MRGDLANGRGKGALAALLALLAGCAASEDDGTTFGDECVAVPDRTPTGGLVTDPQNPDCDDGVCVALGAQSYCTGECAMDEDCPEGMTCLPTDGTDAVRYCFEPQPQRQPSGVVSGSALHAAQLARAAIVADGWNVDEENLHLTYIEGEDVDPSGRITGPDQRWIVFIRHNSTRFYTTVGQGGDTSAPSYLGSEFEDVPNEPIPFADARFDSTDTVALSRELGLEEALSGGWNAASFRLWLATDTLGQPVPMWSVAFGGGAGYWSERFDARTGERVF